MSIIKSIEAPPSAFEIATRIAVSPVISTDYKLKLWARHRGGRLLVVDDSPVERAVTTGLLEKAGFKVVSATNGVEAVSIIRDSPLPFDVVVMDVSMPELDGIAATRKIRALPPPRSHVPIIALTSNTHAEDRAACLAAGMNEHTAKPASMTALLLAMHAHLTPKGATT